VSVIVQSCLDRLRELAFECTRLKEESLQVLGLNLLADLRLSEQRAQHFLEVTGNPGADRIGNAIVKYHDDWVSESPTETYLSRTRNGKNFVARSRLPKDISLVTVLNISGWARRLRIDSEFSGLEPRVALLGDPSATGNQKMEFLDELFRAIQLRRDQRPIWVARWKDFEKSIEVSRPNTWNTSVGVWRDRSDWQLALRYPVAAVPCLVRPTTLDCAPSSLYHFPSPPFRLPTRGGFTMALSEPAPRSPLISEWIHPPIDLKTGYCVPGMLGMAEEGKKREIWIYRNGHMERLGRRFKKEVAGWLPER
jgi:hypothetical protein